MKVLVDKKVCFVGEPVTATFKLYSRLESKSDIVKNPGFYGFTVQDMINLDNRLTAVEISKEKILMCILFAKCNCTRYGQAYLTLTPWKFTIESNFQKAPSQKNRAGNCRRRISRKQTLVKSQYCEFESNMNDGTRCDNCKANTSKK